MLSKYLHPSCIHVASISCCPGHHWTSCFNAICAKTILVLFCNICWLILFGTVSCWNTLRPTWYIQYYVLTQRWLNNSTNVEMYETIWALHLLWWKKNIVNTNKLHFSFDWILHLSPWVFSLFKAQQYDLFPKYPYYCSEHHGLSLMFPLNEL